MDGLTIISESIGSLYTLTYGQTIKLLRDFVAPQNAASRELLDIINHQKILDIVFANYRSQSISEETIKDLHRELMKRRIFEAFRNFG